MLGLYWVDINLDVVLEFSEGILVIELWIEGFFIFGWGVFSEDFYFCKNFWRLIGLVGGLLSFIMLKLGFSVLVIWVF